MYFSLLSRTPTFAPLSAAPHKQQGIPLFSEDFVDFARTFWYSPPSCEDGRNGGDDRLIGFWVKSMI
jgi:hypothetical protein